MKTTDGTLDLVIHQGKTFRRRLVWAEGYTESAGIVTPVNPLSLEGREARAQFRIGTRNGEVALSLTSSPADGIYLERPDLGELPGDVVGRIDIEVSAVRMAELERGGFYDIELYDPLDPAEVSGLIVPSKYFINREVTR